MTFSHDYDHDALSSLYSLQNVRTTQLKVLLIFRKGYEIQSGTPVR